MDFATLLAQVGDAPVFETSLLLAGDVDSADVHRQLSRWGRAGRILQLRRGVYALAVPWRKRVPHPFAVANRLVRSSYVSLQSALAHHGLIPEQVPVTTSVTTRRPGTWDTPLGRYLYRHVQAARLEGYALVDLGCGDTALVATPEKALLDLVHLEPGADSLAYLEGLRLQNLDRLDLGLLTARARRSPKLARAAAHIVTLAGEEAADYEPLDGAAHGGAVAS